MMNNSNINGQKMPFIFTMDEGVKSILLKSGFTLISNNNGQYTFLNNCTLKFDEDINKELKTKVVYTDKLCI